MEKWFATFGKKGLQKTSCELRNSMPVPILTVLLSVSMTICVAG